jgi:hypothetical protein
MKLQSNKNYLLKQLNLRKGEYSFVEMSTIIRCTCERYISRNLVYKIVFTGCKLQHC